MEIEREFGRHRGGETPEGCSEIIERLIHIEARLERIEAMLVLGPRGEDDDREVRAHRGRRRFRMEDHGGDRREGGIF